MNGLASVALADLAASRDRLDVRRSIACAWCTRQFVPAARPGGRGHRFCSKRCQDDARNDRRRIGVGGKRDEMKAMPYPVLLDLPPVPPEVILWGSCIVDRYPPYWTSDDPADRERAKRICRACSARGACTEWSLNLPVADNNIYGGLNKTGRAKLRRERAAQA